VSESRVVNDGTANLNDARCISGALVGRRVANTGPRGGATLTITFRG
jgi:hypothetical protein